VLIGVVIAAVAVPPPVVAHGIFKKTLEKKYEGLRITCNMCHVPKEGKEIRNEFGQMFYEELKELDLSAQWNAVKGAERKALENDVMAPAILEALEKIVEKENAEGKKYGELLPAGLIAGSKLKSASGDDAEEEEEEEEDGTGPT
jgi:hypothetical protein